MIDSTVILDYAKKTLELEIKEAQSMLKRLDLSIVHACNMLLACQGKVIVSGIGKSGHIGKKIAASLASTGTPAFFVHPTEALHGDLGMITKKDLVIFVSYSGCSYEINVLATLLVASSISIIALTGDINSPLAKQSECILNIKIEKEACPMDLVPTASTVNTLMMGDALTMAVMQCREFNVKQFARFHPGGRLGESLSNQIYHVMRTGKDIAQVCYTVTVMDAMFELNRTGIGLTAVCDNNSYVLGVFTDGDLRRWIVQGKSLQDSINIAMTRPGYCFFQEWSISLALKMLHQRKITAAPVINKSEKLVGSINILDLHQVR